MDNKKQKNFFLVNEEDCINYVYTIKQAAEKIDPRNLDDMTLYHFMRVKGMIYKNGFPHKELMKEGYLISKKNNPGDYTTLITPKGLRYVKDIWCKSPDNWLEG
ncbi:hypothetical protein DRF65_16075 [Chryseobacterium pennae]|uniref:Antirepressor protein C-terminal domain-containing protein n=1 Tax=Chryseobacterium pennae TaxID=2258962 RepID=A0A3D9C6S1_9FLAO|nr:hypothetical protein [Chryseobacterium pennae]REC61454.1 hypothetical protein DRF65_16075 [Chryseobacterium pennae]